MEIVAKTIRDTDGQVLWRIQLLSKSAGFSLQPDTTIYETGCLSVDDFASLVKKGTITTEKKTRYQRIKKTPAEFIDGYVTDEEGTFGAIFYHQGGKRQFLLNTGKDILPFFVPMPDLVYMFQINKGQFAKKRCFAAKGNVGDATELFIYPFGNVSESGGICFGNYMPGKLNDFSDLVQVIEDRDLAVTNGDYLVDDYCQIEKAETQEKFLKKLESLDAFPIERLLVGHYIKTLGELKKSLHEHC